MIIRQSVGICHRVRHQRSTVASLYVYGFTPVVRTLTDDRLASKRLISDACEFPRQWV